MKRGKDGEEPGAARPFLKWAGGKTQLLGRILPLLPAKIGTYFEPFIGGGAVFFALANERRFQRAVIGDRNRGLVEVYRAVRDDLPALEKALSRHAPHAKDAGYFYRLRGTDPAALSPVERAARLLYLNKTCFNGLWRVNKSGIFNVPFGRYENPVVLKEGVLRAASEALKCAEVVEADFETIVSPAGSGDAVYFDPPYHPLSKTSSFTAYDPYPFREDEHRRLARVFGKVAGRGARTVLSNSWCPFTCGLYDGYDRREVRASRMINSVARKRGPIAELLVVAPGVSKCAAGESSAS